MRKLSCGILNWEFPFSNIDNFIDQTEHFYPVRDLSAIHIGLMLDFLKITGGPSLASSRTTFGEL